MKKILLILVSIFAFLTIGYMLGPTYPEPDLSDVQIPSIQASPQGLEAMINLEESADNIKQHCRSEIIWADSTKQKTSYSIVYLHGFGACPWEGGPVPQAVADSMNFNLYMHRIAAHGLETKEAMLNYDSDAVLEDALKAIKRAEVLGEKVIVLAMSTGATYALWCAASQVPSLEGLILYSPNIRVADPRASMLVGPWGSQLAELILGGKYRSWEPPKAAEPYFYKRQRIEGTQEMLVLLEAIMQPETFQQVQIPTFVGYFENDTERDEVISVEHVRWMFEELGTPDADKKIKAYVNAKDHNILNPVFSPTAEEAIQDVIRFIEADILQ